ncbi:cysteine proteinase [Coemansia reversa NRRL 1564]|uniref:Cysteine proteinase n=1 Tax=Coemansia reversa (strain ATCC 12441 / NRRL 1564) TaxID=763665 RepID=A0A2G5B900_COERN|nr:cysteine proteinase [Coemansia reversa NRRL 1564]|eukprot:PIA15481.1 cysteine proteinase [Coemansia reversa NRRL 1564]
MTLSYTDIEALQPGEWVTDDVIDFYFRYLKHKYFKDNKKYAFIPVPIANLLTERPVDSSSKSIKDLASDANMLDAETQCLRKPKQIRVAFLPIFGDGHWSLLVYRNQKHRPLPEFLHFNSYLDSTRENHTQCARTALINLLYVFRENDPSMTISKDSYKLVVKNCPQQNNGNDCGVFVCMYAYTLSTRLAKRESEGRSSPLHAVFRRLSVMTNSPPLGRWSDTLSFSSKDPEKDHHDQEEQEWKIKDKDAILPDSMREYLIKIIYSATITQSASASL